MAEGPAGDGIPKLLDSSAGPADETPTPRALWYEVGPVVAGAIAGVFLLVAVTAVIVLAGPDGGSSIPTGEGETAGAAGPADTATNDVDQLETVGETGDDRQQPSTRATSLKAREAPADEDSSSAPNLPSTTVTPTPSTSRCDVDLTSSALADAIECATGDVVLSDSDGPWHNDIAAVFLSDGVTGELSYEASSEDTDQRTVALEPGLTVLDAEAAKFGVNNVVIEMRQAGDHVHFHAAADRSGRRATLIFDDS